MYRLPMPRITIVTPSYQQASFLERTIESVLSQGYPNLEYMIFDGGSTDGSVEIIKRYANKLACWDSEPDGGQSAAINKGLRQASGEILGWLNSDDTLAKRSLWKIGEFYARHPEVDLLYGHTHVIDADDRVLRRLISVPTCAKELIHYTRDIWSQPGTTWRRRLQERIGLLDESLHYAMDGDFWIRAAMNGRICCFPTHLANLRKHSLTKSRTAEGKFREEHRELDSRYGPMIRQGFAFWMFSFRRKARIILQPRNWAYKMGIIG